MQTIQLHPRRTLPFSLGSHTRHIPNHPIRYGRLLTSTRPTSIRLFILLNRKRSTFDGFVDSIATESERFCRVGVFDVEGEDEFEATADVGGRSTSMKPISARGADRAANSSGRPRSSSHTRSATVIKTEPEGKEERETDSADAKAIPTLECPICGRHLETDNQGFNAHVDFCLSKEAIREAQTASLSSKPPSSGAGFGSSSSAAARRTGHKPMSKQGKKERRGSTGHGEGILRFTKRA